MARKDKKNQHFSVSSSTILYIEDSILDTFPYCEKLRDLDFQSILDTIFSGLVSGDNNVNNMLNVDDIDNFNDIDNIDDINNFSNIDNIYDINK